MTFRLHRQKSEGDTTPPISIGEQTKVRLPFVWILALVSATVSATVGWQNLKSADSVAQATLEKDESRLAKIEAEQAQFVMLKEDVAVMKNDVQWIRRALEREDHTALANARPGS